MNQVRKTLSWFDENALLIAIGFLLAFIPLFPKIPLFDILPGYIVRVRAEDFFVFLTALLWIVQIARKKVVWKTNVTVLVALYAVAGLLSMLLGSILTETIPPYFIHFAKSALHFFRYFEYFSLFFFAYSAISEKKHLVLLTKILALTVIAVGIYGAGQKYLHWPLYSTMNREFSKGETLYLTEYARVQSTFAGHYDMTAYLVLVLPILFALLLKTKNWGSKILYAAAQASGIWLLLAGSSKSSFAAYAVTLLVVVYFVLKRKHASASTWIRWGSLTIAGICLLIGSILFAVPEAYRTTVKLTQSITPVYSLFKKIDAQLPLNSKLRLDTVSTDEQRNKPDDVYVDVPDLIKVATTSATGEPTFLLVEKERTWSENALKYGLSMGIRLDTLWPQALQGFTKNPLTGSGYGTLNKGDTAVYTEADSTDNNYLRVLGETGLLGFTIFFGTVFMLLRFALQKTKASESVVMALASGFVAGTIGLLINAITIDVFTASKVAFSFWGISGIMYATEKITNSKDVHTDLFKQLKSWSKQHSVLIVVLLTAFFTLYQNPFAEKSSIINFAQNPGGAEHIVAARCLLDQAPASLCASSMQKEPNLSIYSIALVPFLKLYNNPGVYFIFNMVMTLGLILILYILLQKVSANKRLQQALVLLFITAEIVRTSPETPHLSVQPFILACALVAFAWTFENLLRLTSSQRVRKSATLGIPLFFLFVAVQYSFTFFSPQNIQNIGKNFRSDHENWRYIAVTQINRFFYDGTVGAEAKLDPSKKPYLITATDPYYVELFSNNMYSVLPLPSDSDKKTEAFIEQYHSALQERPVFMSSIDLDNGTQASFDLLKKAFSVDIERIGCNYNCLLYSITEKKELVSPQPLPFINRFDTLPSDPFTFSVISNRFDVKQNPTPHTLQSSAPIFTEAATVSDFVIATGDVLPKYDQGQKAAFQQLYGSTVPILFVPGNQDISPKSEVSSAAGTHFFTESEFFLFLATNADGSIGESQQQYLLNRLLDLENMEQISTIFVVIDRANWVGYHPNLQDMSGLSVSRSPRSTDTFMVTQFLPRLADLSEKTIFVISGDMYTTTLPGSFFTTLPNSNLTFIASSISTNSTADRYVTFSKEQGIWKYYFVPTP